MQQVRNAMLATPLLEGVPEGAVRRSPRREGPSVPEGHVPVPPRGRCDRDIFFLVEGRVEISSTSVTGSRVLHATVDIPQFVGELGVLAEIDRTASVLTLEDSSVWIASADDFLEFLASEPSAARSLLRVLARQVHSHEAFVDDLLFLDLKGRVAKRLLQMATPSLDDLPDDGTAIPAVTHADLASLCGGSRENVTRVLSEFQRRALLERDGKRYVLKKVDGLARIAGL